MRDAGVAGDLLRLEEFVLTECRGDLDYLRNVNLPSKLERYMERYNEEAFPNLEWDKDIAVNMWQLQEDCRICL